MNARILEIADKRSGLNLLRVPDAATRGYPDLSGAVVSVLPDYRGRPYEVEWRQEAAGGREVMLSGAGPQGLRLRRRVWLSGDEAAAHTATVVENAGSAPVRVAVQARAEYGPRDELDGAGLALRFRVQDGSSFDSSLFQPGQETTGRVTLSGSKRPAGGWEAYHRGEVPGMVNLFRVEQAERCVMEWSLRGATVITLSLWSKEGELKPGEVVALDADYGVARR